MSLHKNPNSMQRLVIFNISNRLKFGQKGQNNLLNFSYFTWTKMVIGTQKHYVLTFVKDSYLVKLEITGNLSKPKNDPLLFFFKSVCPVSLFACFLLFWFDFFFSSSQWTMNDQIPWVLVFVTTCLPKI